MWLQGILLAFGGLMSFSTRQVSSHFGNRSAIEFWHGSSACCADWCTWLCSKGIALGIYNFIFTGLIVLPIIFMTGVRGNALVLLM